MPEAKDLATFIVEPVGTDINSPDSFTVRKRFQDTETTTTYTTSQVSTMFSDIMDQLSRPTASSSGMKGGLLYLKNGTYLLNTSAGISVSNTTDDQDVSVRIVGESRQNTILKSPTSTTNDIIRFYCSLDVENITFDGNSEASVIGIAAESTGDANKVLRVKNCRFTNMEDFDIQIGHNQLGIDVSDCQFDNHQVSNDQMAFECTGWARIHNNYFDKTTGTLTGETLTSGTCVNTLISNNTIKRTTHDNGGISLEIFDANPANEKIHIIGNLLVNAGISLGSSGSTFTNTMKHATISGNALYGGGIRVLGSNTGDSTTQLTYISIIGNSIYDAYEHGIKIVDAGGPIFIRDNTICNTNISSGSNISYGAIDLEACHKVICENNSILMEANVDSDVNINGIRYRDTTDLTLRYNRILNRGSNQSYTSSGSQTGSTLISRSL